MKTPARWWAVGIVVIVVLSQTAWTRAADPVIDIPQDAAEGALQGSHRKQIDEYVAHYLGEMIKATTQKDIVAHRGKLVDAYVKKYGTRATEYMVAFAGSVAKHGQPMLTAVPADDPLGMLKKINLAITASKMGQVSLGPLAAAMVSHPDPAMRYFGWEAYAAMRTSVLAAGGKPAEDMFKTLGERLQKETDPQVLAQMMKMFVFRGAAGMSANLSPQAYEAGLARFFKILEANWVALCQKTLQGNGTVAEAATVAIDAAGKLKGVLKDQVEDKAVAQMLGNMIWSLGKAYDKALTIQDACGAVTVVEAAERLLADDPSDLNVAAAKSARQKLQEAAKNAKMAVKDLPSKTEAEYTVSAIAKALTDCESALASLTGARNNFVKKELNATGAAVRLGTLKWVEDVLIKKYQIKHPKETVAPE